MCCLFRSEEVLIKSCQSESNRAGRWDIRAKISVQSIDFFLNFNCSQIMSYLCQNCKKKLGVTDCVSEIERVVNYPDLEKLEIVI